MLKDRSGHGIGTFACSCFVDTGASRKKLGGDQAKDVFFFFGPDVDCDQAVEIHHFSWVCCMFFCPLDVFFHWGCNHYKWSCFTLYFGSTL